MKPISAIALGSVLLASAASQAAVSPSTPPDCAAIAFRPVLLRQGDGTQDTGLYKSRFGRIEVKAQVAGGAVQNYFVELNGQPLGPAATLPASIATCAKAKLLGAPGAAEAACIGDQLKILIDHSADARYVLLYAHRAGAWHFCSAGTA